MPNMAQFQPPGSTTVYDIKDNSAVASITIPTDNDGLTITMRDGTSSTIKDTNLLTLADIKTALDVS